MDTKDCNIISKEKKFTAKKVVSLVFVIIFALITLCFPIMYAFGVSAGKNYEQKALKEMPKINELFTNYSGFADDFDEHYNDHFPLKSKMVELYSYTEYKVFNTSLVPSVTSIGKNGWLFYESSNTRKMVSGKYVLSDAQLERIYNGIMKKYQILSDLGKKYVIFLAAEKQTIYPEYDRLENADYTAIDQLIEYLNERDCPVPFIYSKDYLLSKKTATNQLFYKYDTHWNKLGSHYGYEAVMNVIKPMFPDKNVPVCTEFGLGTSTRSGDLATTIYLSEYLTEKTPSLKYEYKPTYSRKAPINFVKSSVPSDIKIFIYGDSFSLSDYWGAAFAQTSSETRILHNKNSFQVLLNNLGESDVVIEECVQRAPTTLGNCVIDA